MSQSIFLDFRSATCGVTVDTDRVTGACVRCSNPVVAVFDGRFATCDYHYGQVEQWPAIYPPKGE
jgi:hypothetical protein